MKKAFQLFVPVIVILAMMLSFVPAHPVQAVSTNIVISQVYGGAGCSAAGCSTYKNDYVEIFNRGTASVNLTGYSVQYASAAGSFNGVIASLSGTLAPGQYYLVAAAFGTNGVNTIPTPDATGTTALGATAGKIALVNGTSALACGATGTTPAPCSSSQLAQIVDLVGFGTTATLYEGAGPAPAPSTTTADFRINGGCTDTDHNSADFAAATPAPRNTASPLNVCSIVADTAPTVTSSVPLDGVTNFPVGSDLSVSFSEPVNVTDPWFSLTCSVSGSVPAVVTGGPSTFTINPDTSLVSGESCTLQVFAAGVSDQDLLDPPDTMDADYSVAFTPFDVCVQTFTPIYDIQGSGATVALTGSRTTMGVVVGDYEGASPALRGFFIQDMTGDGDPATSDGIFVFEGSNSNTVNLGDVVRVTGNAGENQGQSQISVGTITKCGTGSVDPADVTFPVSTLTYLEQYEGMLVRLPQTMFVTEHFQLGRFDQVVLSANGRLQQPTNVTTPGAAAFALQEQNNLNKIILDDASQAQNPDPILFARDGAPLSASNTLRGGDTATNIVGVMTYTWAGNSASPNAYRIRPINALNGYVNFEPTNPRPVAAPERSGSLRVVGMNLLNYFNTFTGCANGFGGAPTDCRGADTQTEFDRQWPKTVAAIISANADIFGFTEIENDGYGPESAIQDLVNKLNTAAGEGTYAFIDADTGTGQVNALGTDAIKVGFVYKTSTVMPIGATAALNSVEFVNGGDTAARNRPALAQAFQEVSTGARFVVAVNHLKSKGSACDAPDAFDGQGNCNQVRVNAATLLSQWLAGDPTGSGDPDALIIGDLNSYAMEDPITALLAAGYTNLVKEFGGDEAYSYVFDGQWGYLDHALSNASLTAQVANVADWHIDADEPSVLDYNTDFKTANLISSLYAPDFYRIGDHDPVLIDLNLTNDPPTASTTGPYTADEGNQIILDSSGSDPDGTPVTFAWDLNNDGIFEILSQSVTFDAVDGTFVYPVSVRVTDATGLTTVASTTVTVNNVAPSVGTISAPTDPVLVKTAVDVSVDFTDPGVQDAHTALIDWGDGSTSEGIVTETGGSGSVTGEHQYSTAGFYPVTIIVTDKDGGFGTSTFENVIIYNPNGGFLTGSGWFTSPEDGYKAKFDVVAKYKKGATVPDGATSLLLRDDLSFASTSYTWSVIVGKTAYLSGSGTINGEGDYSLLITEVDDSPDKIQIKIWDANGVVYDTMALVDLGGGNISIK